MHNHSLYTDHTLSYLVQLIQSMLLKLLELKALLLKQLLIILLLFHILQKIYESLITFFHFLLYSQILYLSLSIQSMIL